MAYGYDPNSNDLELDAIPNRLPVPSHKQEPYKTRLSDQEVFDKYPFFPSNQDGGAMEGIDLVHIVILYSSKNYDKVFQFNEWLENIKQEEGLDECIVHHFDDSIFPPDNVAKVKDIFERAIKVLLFLTPEFCNDENLRFLSTEGIVQTRLNNDPKTTRLGKLTRSQKKYCMRPVHTMPRDGRSYRVPTGLGDVYGIDYYNRESNKAYTRRQAVLLLKDSITQYKQREKALTSAVTGADSLYEEINQQYQNQRVSTTSGKTAQYYDADFLKNTSPDERAQKRQPEQDCTTSRSSIVTSSGGAFRSAPCSEYLHDRDQQIDPAAPQKILVHLNGKYPIGNESIIIDRGNCTGSINNDNPPTSTSQLQKHLSDTDNSIRASHTPQESSDGFDLCQNQDVVPVTATVERFPASVLSAVDRVIRTPDPVATDCTEEDDNNDIIEIRDSVDTENTERNGYEPKEQITERTGGQRLNTRSVCGSSNTTNATLSTRPITSFHNVPDTQIQESVDNRNSSSSSSLDIDAGLDTCSLSSHGKTDTGTDTGEVQSLLDDQDEDSEMRNTNKGAQIKNDGQSIQSNLDAKPLKSDYATQSFMNGANAEPTKNCSDIPPSKDGSDDQPLKNTSGPKPLKNGLDDQPLMTNLSNFQVPPLDKGQLSNANFATFKTEKAEINKTAQSNYSSDVRENVLNFSGPAKSPVAKCAATSMSDFPDTDEVPVTGFASNVTTERVEVHVHKHYHHYQEKEEKKQSIHITGCNVVQLGPHSKILTNNVAQNQSEAQFRGLLKEESVDESLVTPDSATTWNDLSSEGSPTWPSHDDCILKQMKDADTHASDSDESNETKAGQISEFHDTVNCTGELDNLPSGYDTSYTVGEEEDFVAKRNVADICDSTSVTDVKDDYLDEKLNFEPNDLVDEVNNYDMGSVLEHAVTTHKVVDSNQSANMPCQSTCSGPVEDTGNVEHKNGEELTRNIKAKVTDNFRFRGGSYIHQGHGLQHTYYGILTANHVDTNDQSMHGAVHGESEGDID